MKYLKGAQLLFLSVLLLTVLMAVFGSADHHPPAWIAPLYKVGLTPFIVLLMYAVFHWATRKRPWPKGWRIVRGVQYAAGILVFIGLVVLCLAVLFTPDLSTFGN